MNNSAGNYKFEAPGAMIWEKLISLDGLLHIALAVGLRTAQEANKANSAAYRQGYKAQRLLPNP